MNVIVDFKEVKEYLLNKGFAYNTANEQYYEQCCENVVNYYNNILDEKNIVVTSDLRTALDKIIIPEICACISGVKPTTKDYLTYREELDNSIALSIPSAELGKTWNIYDLLVDFTQYPVIDLITNEKTYRIKYLPSWLSNSSAVRYSVCKQGASHQVYYTYEELKHFLEFFMQKESCCNKMTISERVAVLEEDLTKIKDEINSKQLKKLDTSLEDTKEWEILENYAQNTFIMDNSWSRCTLERTYIKQLKEMYKDELSGIRILEGIVDSDTPVVYVKNPERILQELRNMFTYMCFTQNNDCVFLQTIWKDLEIKYYYGATLTEVLLQVIATDKLDLEILRTH